MKDKKFILLENGRTVYIVLSEKEDRAVKLAAENLAGDIQKVCGCTVKKISRVPDTLDESETAIVIATMHESAAGICETYPCRTELLYENGRMRWEAYLQQVTGKILYILGTDRRGSIFGIYDLCEQIGVSPWYFWADVPVKKKDRFAMPQDYCKSDWPSVAYRGIFLNDEEELDAWSKLHTKDGTIGPDTYGRIFELILRLKGNYIWPAMHVNFFNENPENGRLAHEMGIVVGTSHCDMLLRSNQNEWSPWISQKGYQGALYDYSILGGNREIIQEYWKESVEQNREYEVCYTVGMRGIHDSGFVTKAIEEDTSLQPEEKADKKVRLLEQVISDQRQIIKEVLGEKRGESALQTFIPYKEVLDLYDSGLQLPEDVTLIWVDDNFGYMRRYPNEREQARLGGNGLYYHASYWAHPGMSYLFFNSIPLAQTGNELKKCWESGIRKMWVLNVGALKPLEIDMEFFLTYGWEAGKGDGDAKDPDTFLRRWLERNFSGGHEEEMARIYNRFSQLVNVCKLEHMQSQKFSQTAYGNEAAARLGELKALFDQANGIYCGLPKEEQTAFFEMILMKIQAAYFINASFYYADRSRLSWERGAMQAAEQYLVLSREMDDNKRCMLHYYNKIMMNGKWEGIMTPESFSPPPTVLYPAAKPALVIGEPSLGVSWEPDDFIFDIHGSWVKNFTLHNKGCGSVSFTIQAPDWLDLSVTSGKVAAELTISCRLHWDDKAISTETSEGIILVCGENGERYEIAVQVKGRLGRGEVEQILMQGIAQHAIGDSFFMEADGYVSIPADCYAENKEASLGNWRRIRHLGRGRGDAMEAFCVCAGRNWMDDIPSHPCLSYRFCLESSGSFLLEIFRFVTLNPKGRIRLAVGVDEYAPILAETETVDEWKGAWKEAVMNDGEKLLVSLPFLKAGRHILKLYPLDCYITLNKLVIYTQDRKMSNMGPAVSAYFDGGQWREAGISAFADMETVSLGSAREDVYERTNAILSVCSKPLKESASELRQIFYGIDIADVPQLPMLYAPADFWKSERLYTCSDARENRLGAEKYLTDERGRKNVFACFGAGIFAEQGGRIAIEAEYALENSVNAWLTPNAEGITWTHTQAETDGRTGLAMMIEGKKLFWENPMEAPGMSYRIKVDNAGEYYIWLLMKFEDADSDSCILALDGAVQALEEQFGPGSGFFTYSMKQRWHWRALSKLKLPEGIHEFSILGRKSGLRIDRIYMARDEEWPPIDADWEKSVRHM